MLDKNYNAMVCIKYNRTEDPSTAKLRYYKSRRIQRLNQTQIEKLYSGRCGRGQEFWRR